MITQYAESTRIPCLALYFLQLGSAEVPTKAALSKSWFSSRSTTPGYTAAVDLHLKGSKHQCGHPSAFKESRRVSKYHEGKRAIQIRSGACGLVCLERARGLFPFVALSGALPKSLFLGDWLSL
ncbi:hypothetical protein RF11_06226 [Thelohanellus kitauei]|uniref:Uncharacterized protein n=1 Tax=Thelohanellus kitauei TaxID=669202 RepID=A0A0C2MH84_THEKT|nr:hypothetical protein RF11_06226 [Thelohanellus kitauei]